MTISKSMGDTGVAQMMHGGTESSRMVNIVPQVTALSLTSIITTLKIFLGSHILSHPDHNSWLLNKMHNGEIFYRCIQCSVPNCTSHNPTENTWSAFRKVGKGTQNPAKIFPNVHYISWIMHSLNVAKTIKRRSEETIILLWLVFCCPSPHAYKGLNVCALYLRGSVNERPVCC